MKPKELTFLTYNIYKIPMANKHFALSLTKLSGSNAEQLRRS